MVVNIQCNSLPDTQRWNDPCGTERKHAFEPKFMPSKKMWHHQLGRSLRKIQKQLNITIETLQAPNVQSVVRRCQKGVDENQYIPNWVPGIGNVLIHGSKPTRLKVSGYLPNLHTELQRFAVAMEAIIHMDPKRTIVNDTNTYLIQFLCEVEGALVMLQISVPAREQRSLMAEEERNPPDVTRRLIRDWGILIKYRDYLYSWSKLMSLMEKRRKKHKARKQTTKVEGS